MTSPEPVADVPDWATLFASESAAGAFESDRSGISGLWTALHTAADASDGQLKVALDALGKIASLFVRPDDWNQPYGPAMQFEGRRSAIPTDLTEDELSTLRACAPSVPHALLRARVFDVLFLIASGRDRIDVALQHLDAMIDAGIADDGWGAEQNSWDRALLVARRLRQPTQSRLSKLEQELRRVVRTSSEGYLPLRVADMLAKHALAADRATVIARRLQRLANGSTDDPERFRAYLLGAAEWFARGGDHSLAHQVALTELQSLIDQAETAATANENQGAMRASHLFELALQRVRTFPRSVRDDLGIADMPRLIARRIREMGAASLGSMRAFESGSIDLTSAATEARDRVSGLSSVDALEAFCRLAEFANYEQELANATRLLNEHPLQALLTTVHFSADGRVVFRSGGGDDAVIYGVTSAIWKQLVQSVDLRIRLYSQGALWPAYVQLTNEHNLSLGDFAAVVRSSGIVPADRVMQYARGLYYGYNGDFSSASQLLTPQIENLVRYHLANAGEITSYITSEQTEMELGISSLMDRESATEVFGDDIAFEIRALLCGPIGPNLRNEIAHGLLSDVAASGGSGLYLWWFALRFVFIPYWNALHDTDAAEAREPARPGFPDEDTA